eukprot:6292685-Ditylum_brightwellii.AAC.1
MVWCKKHKKEGKYDGMYYPKLHNHAAWQKRVKKNKEVRQANQNKQKVNADASNSTSSLNVFNKKSKLVPSNNLKAVLCTICRLSDRQMKDMVKAYNSKNS